MASPHPDVPQQGTGLPPGVEVGPLGARLVAYVIDSIIPAVLVALLGFLVPGMSSSAGTVLSVVFSLLIVAWVVLVWRLIAVRAASPGMRLMKLQVVGFYNGRPIGWGRAFLRGFVLWLLSLTGIGLVIMLVLLLLHPRKQGWHDLAAKAVVIKERTLAPSRVPASVGAAAAPQLPPPPAQPTDAAEAKAEQAPAGYHFPASEAGQQGLSPDVPPPLTPPAGASAVGGSGPPPLARPAKTAPLVPSTAGRQERVSSGWVAELDDGREISIEGLVLLGRNPQPQPGEEDAQLIKLADETRTVSKSHLGIGQDLDGLFVVDRGSTNGSTVTTPDGLSTRVPTGDVVRVEAGSVVSIGDHWLRIRRTSSDGDPANPR